MVADVYLELVHAVCEAVPQGVQEIVHSQLVQLNAMSIPGIVDDAALHLEGDQYRAYG